MDAAPPLTTIEWANLYARKHYNACRRCEWELTPSPGAGKSCLPRNLRRTFKH